jgi:hypothetical protein
VHAWEASYEHQGLREADRAANHREQERGQRYKCQQDLGESGMDLDEPVIDQPEPGANVEQAVEQRPTSARPRGNASPSSTMTASSNAAASANRRLAPHNGASSRLLNRNTLHCHRRARRSSGMR